MLNIMLIGMSLLIASQPAGLSHKPRSHNNPSYSIHNYKKPHSIGVPFQEETTKGVIVNKMIAQPINYKHQRSAEQPTGSVTVSSMPTSNSSVQNYKRPHK